MDVSETTQNLIRHNQKAAAKMRELYQSGKFLDEEKRELTIRDIGQIRLILSKTTELERSQMEATLKIGKLVTRIRYRITSKNKTRVPKKLAPISVERYLKLHFPIRDYRRLTEAAAAYKAVKCGVSTDTHNLSSLIMIGEALGSKSNSRKAKAKLYIKKNSKVQSSRDAKLDAIIDKKVSIAEVRQSLKEEDEVISANKHFNSLNSKFTQFKSCLKQLLESLNNTQNEFNSKEKESFFCIVGKIDKYDFKTEVQKIRVAIPRAGKNKPLLKPKRIPL